MATSAFATEEIELETIIVTAGKNTAPSFNRQAESKSELAGQEFTERGINQIDKITRQVANFHSNNQGIGSFGQVFSLRGLTNSPVFGAPSVVFYVDDVPYSNAISTMGSLFNVNKATVYRSSQPGSFGKNAYAGAVDMKTRQPENILSGGIGLELANYDFYQVSAHADGALINDKLYFSLSGNYQQRDGFLYNSFLNTRPDNTENFSGNASLKWTPDKNWDVRLIFSKENFDYGASRFVRLDSPNFFTVRSEIAEQLKQHSNSQALRIAYNTEDYEVLSVTSRRFWQMSPRVVDLDLLPTPFTRIQELTDEAWTQELKIRSTVQNSDWQWQAGLFYSNSDKRGSSHTLVAGNKFSINLNRLAVDNYAAFGRLSYQGINDLTVHVDLRLDYVDSRVDADNSYPQGRQLFLQQHDSSFFVSPKLSLNYTISPNLLLYTSTALAFKPSGFTIANLNQNLSHYKKETAWQNEIGLKTHWFDKQFSLNLAGFYYDIDNYQVERFFTALDYGMANAEKAHSYGFEVESQTKLLNNLWLETLSGYTYTQFDRYRDPITRTDYAGKAAPFVPDFTSTIALQYKHPDGYFARAEWLWTGRKFFDETNSDIMHQNDYSIANIRIGYKQQNYSVYAFANNLTNTRYYTYIIGGTRGTPGDPRMIGVKLGVEF